MISDLRMLRRQGSFRRLWGAKAVSNLGDWTYALAVVVSLTERGAAAHALSVLLIMQMAPSALAGLLGAPLADRLPRKQLMIGADVLRALAVATLLLSPDPSLAHFYAVAVCLGMFGSVFEPSLQASLPNVVAREQLVSANAVINATFNFAILAGPPLGGAIAATLGASPAFALNAATFALSALLLRRLHLPPQPAEAVRTGQVEALVAGLRYSLRTPVIRSILLVTGLIMFAAAIRMPLEPLYYLRELESTALALGAAGGLWGAGMLLGCGLAPAAARAIGRHRLLAVAVALVATAIVAISQSPILAPVLLLCVVGGMGNGLGTVAYETLLQEETPDAIRGRVIATSESVLDGSLLLGAAAGGWLGSLFGVRPALLASGAVLVLAAVLSSALVRPSPAAGREPEPVAEPERALAGPALVDQAA